jgi:hypothetical protein
MKKIANLLIFISIFIAVIFSSVLLTAYFERNSRPKLVCSPFTERRNSYVKYCVPNPFRDKKPEQTAENFLQNLKNNQIEAVLPYLRSGGKEPEKDVGREKDLLPVSSWRIINREIERDGRYRISYVYRQKDSGDEIPLGFYFVKDKDGRRLDEIVGFW